MYTGVLYFANRAGIAFWYHSWCIRVHLWKQHQSITCTSKSKLCIFWWHLMFLILWVLQEDCLQATRWHSKLYWFQYCFCNNSKVYQSLQTQTSALSFNLSIIFSLGLVAGRNDMPRLVLAAHINFTPRHWHDFHSLINKIMSFILPSPLHCYLDHLSPEPSRTWKNDSVYGNEKSF